MDGQGFRGFLAPKKNLNEPSSCVIKILGMNYRKLEGVFLLTECRYCSYMTKDLIL